MIGIISYLPDDLAVRKKRTASIEKQIQWLRSVLGNEPIIVCAQNYKTGDYSHDSAVEYVNFSSGIGPARARNEILKRFYRSSDSCLLLLDDDNTMYPYYDYEELFKNLYYQFDNFGDIDFVCCVDPAREAFKATLFNNQYSKDYYILKRASINCCPNVMFLRNFSKFGRPQIFYDDSYVVGKDPEAFSEDLDFVSQLIVGGNKCYQCLNFIKRPLAYANSTLFSKKENQTSHSRLIVKFADRWSSRGIKYEGKLNTSEFMRRYNLADSFKYIKRSKRYSFPDNLIPEGNEATYVTTPRRLWEKKNV